MRISTVAALSIILSGWMSVPSVTAAPLLYGVNGGHNDGTSINDGSLVTVNQTTAAVSLVGHPDNVARLTGLAFDASGALWASTLSPAFPAPPPPPPTSSALIRIDPITGAQLSSVPITFGGVALSIADLAAQPGTGTIFGVTGPNGPGPARLFTLNKTTGNASLIGSLGAAAAFSFASIAFDPSGLLFASLANFAAGPINPTLATLNPLNGAVLTSVPTNDFFGAFGIRDDGVIFGGTGDEHELFTINRATGAQTLIGDTGTNYVGDLAFQPVPEPATLTLLGVGLAGLWGRRLRRQ